MKTFLYILAAGSLLGIAACKNTITQQEKAANVTLSATEEAKAAQNFIGVAADSTAQAPGPDQKQINKTAPPANPDWDKKIIKNATVNLQVKDYSAFNRATRQSVKQWGGYIAQEEQNESDYKIENTLTIKVPVTAFDDMVQALSSGAEKVLVKKITSEDVTAQYIDTKARLEAKQQVRLRYLDMLKQAKNMAEVLQVQNEINDIQEEVEAAAGQVGYLSHAAAYSTVQLTYYQVLNAAASNETELSFAQKMLQAVQNGFKWVGELLLLLLNLWPVLLVTGSVVWLVRKWKPAKAVQPGTEK